MAPNGGKKMGLRLSEVGGVAGRSQSGGVGDSKEAKRKDKGEEKKSKDHYVSQSSQKTRFRLSSNARVRPTHSGESSKAC